MIVALVLAVAYLIWQPPSADLAAQVFRTDLFADHGFVLFNTHWYGGHTVPGYSLLFPPLAALLTPQLVGAISAVAAAACFDALARDHFGERARLGSLWFGAATATMLFTGRLTFSLGMALGLGAMLALQRGRVATACALAVLASFGSPVVGVFVALAAIAVAIGGDRRAGAITAAGALGGLLVMSFPFPTAGNEPFEFNAFLFPLFVTAGMLLVLPAEERVLRIGTAVYGLLCVVLLLVPTPIGGNVARLGALTAGPILALVLWRKRNLALALAAIPLLYWQWVAPVRDLTLALGDPSVQRSYYSPLLRELHERVDGPVRIEIPPTARRWEAAYVAPRYSLARGWLRQLESSDFDTFDGGRLTASSYRAWLRDWGVSYVAVPDADLDYLAEDEVRLIDRGLPYLRPLWKGAHWRLYAVRGTHGLVDGPGRLVALPPDSFTLDARRRGRYLVRLHYTHYWTVVGGDACVMTSGDWTGVQAKHPGRIRVDTEFSLGALLGRNRECSS